MMEEELLNEVETFESWDWRTGPNLEFKQLNQELKGGLDEKVSELIIP